MGETAKERLYAVVFAWGGVVNDVQLFRSEDKAEAAFEKETGRSYQEFAAGGFDDEKEDSRIFECEVED
jgi:hypothetical protein